MVNKTSQKMTDLPQFLISKEEVQTGRRGEGLSTGKHSEQKVSAHPITLMITLLSCSDQQGTPGLTHTRQLKKSHSLGLLTS